MIYIAWLYQAWEMQMSLWHFRMMGFYALGISINSLNLKYVDEFNLNKQTTTTKTGKKESK